MYEIWRFSRRNWLKLAGSFGAGAALAACAPAETPQPPDPEIPLPEKLKDKGAELAMAAAMLSVDWAELSDAAKKTLVEKLTLEAKAQGFRGQPLGKMEFPGQPEDFGEGWFVVKGKNLLRPGVNPNGAYVVTVKIDGDKIRWGKFSTSPGLESRLRTETEAIKYSLELAGTEEGLIDSFRFYGKGEEIPLNGVKLVGHTSEHLGPTLHFMLSEGKITRAEAAEYYLQALDNALRILTSEDPTKRYIRHDPNPGNLVLIMGKDGKLVSANIDWATAGRLVAGRSWNQAAAVVVAGYNKQAILTLGATNWQVVTIEQVLTRITNTSQLSLLPAPSGNALLEVADAAGDISRLAPLPSLSVGGAGADIEVAPTGATSRPLTGTERVAKWVDESGAITEAGFGALRTAGDGLLLIIALGMFKELNARTSKAKKMIIGEGFKQTSTYDIKGFVGEVIAKRNNEIDGELIITDGTLDSFEAEWGNLTRLRLLTMADSRTYLTHLEAWLKDNTLYAAVPLEINQDPTNAYAVVLNGGKTLFVFSYPTKVDGSVDYEGEPQPVLVVAENEQGGWDFSPGLGVIQKAIRTGDAKLFGAGAVRYKLTVNDWGAMVLEQAANK